MAGTFRVDVDWRIGDGNIFIVHIVVFRWDPKRLGSRVCAVLWALRIVLLLSFIGTPEWSRVVPGVSFRGRAKDTLSGATSAYLPLTSR